MSWDLPSEDDESLIREETREAHEVLKSEPYSSLQEAVEIFPSNRITTPQSIDDALVKMDLYYRFDSTEFAVEIPFTPTELRKFESLGFSLRYRPALLKTKGGDSIVVDGETILIALKLAAKSNFFRLGVDENRSVKRDLVFGQIPEGWALVSPYETYRYLLSVEQKIESVAQTLDDRIFMYGAPELLFDNLILFGGSERKWKSFIKKGIVVGNSSGTEKLLRVYKKGMGLSGIEFVQDLDPDSITLEHRAALQLVRGVSKKFPFSL